jgi:hypothetical protein
MTVVRVAVTLLVLFPTMSWAGGGGGFVGVGGGKAHFGAGKTQGGFVKSVRSRQFTNFTPDPVPSVFPKTVDPWKFWGVNKFHHGFFNHRHSFVHPGFFGGGVVYGTPVYYATAPDPVVYAPPTTYVPTAYAPVPAPMPTVVEYATGRYELRGDGITTAYQWVWIPRPPSAPPPEVAPEPTPQSAPPARDRAIGKIYRWTDDEGVTTLTDRLENVPEKYRSKVQSKT